VTALGFPRIVISRPLVVPLIGTAVSVAVIATGVALHLTTGRLGTATPPFVMGWNPKLHGLAVLGVALAGVACVGGAQLLDARLPPTRLAVSLYGFGLATALAVNLVRHGVRGWTAAFDLGPHGSFEAPNEYLPGLPALSYGTRFFLDRFAEIVPSQPVNVAGHPPGLLLLMHLLRIDTAAELATLVIAAGACTAPLTYLLARPLAAERHARLAALLAAFAPSTLLFGVTSADWLYAAAATGAGALLVRPRCRAAGTVGLAAASLLSWALLAVGAWATLVTWQREGARRAVVLAAGCGVAVLALNSALAAAYGYDPIGALRAAHAVYRNSIASERPYAFWVFGSPVAWLATLGLPSAWMALRGLGAREPLAVATFTIVAVAAVLGFTKAEVERIWLFVVPLAALAAAAQDPGRPRLLLAVLVGQALAVEALFGTVW
jgi:hypothetical protein